MSQGKKIYLVQQPDEELPPADPVVRAAPLAYRIDEQLRLCRSSSFLRPRKGLMMIACRGVAAAGPVTTLAGEILRECMLQDYCGVLLDLPRPLPRSLSFLTAALAPALRRQGLAFYLPDPLPTGIPAIPVLTHAPLDEEEAAAFRRRAAVCGAFSADLRVRRRLLTLPERGQGRVLAPGEAEEILRRGGGEAFDSPELLARYGTVTQEGRVKMLLWDTRETLLQRLQSLQKAGAESVFLLQEESLPLWGAGGMDAFLRDIGAYC